jgi:ABC-type bacteriocin/lantibiotic exporter with double-glycine peptidase domain
MRVASLNVPHHKQEQRFSCLVACVRMVLAHYGHTCSEQELCHLLHTDALGSRARDVLGVASLGLDVQLPFSRLSDLGAALLAGTPPIVFLDTGVLAYWTMDCPHVAVVVGLNLTTVFLNDPYFDLAPQQTSLTSFLSA